VLAANSHGFRKTTLKNVTCICYLSQSVIVFYWETNSETSKLTSHWLDPAPDLRCKTQLLTLTLYKTQLKLFKALGGWTCPVSSKYWVKGQNSHAYGVSSVKSDNKIVEFVQGSFFKVYISQVCTSIPKSRLVKIVHLECRQTRLVGSIYLVKPCLIEAKIVTKLQKIPKIHKWII
jgi:hypothetical protein